ncbi:hypothetical protein BDR05DRAFT_959741 [Suillus weaverae]|nr:hypothetical protein BDR05DRAFT_959741 [Suillus weaverae]
MKTLSQNARGSKLTIPFIFTSDGTPGRTYPLCYHVHAHDYDYSSPRLSLNLDRPTEYLAYLVDPRFPNRSNAIQDALNIRRAYYFSIKSSSRRVHCTQCPSCSESL